MKYAHLTPRHFYLSALGVSVCTLAAVLTMEYGFGLKPCELCTAQRVPYAAAILVALFGLSVKPRNHHLLLGLLSLLFMASVVLGIYHAGVEKKIFEGPTACTISGDQSHLTLEELKAKIMGAPVVACNQPQWEWHGITLALLNAVWSLDLFMFFSFGYFQHRRQQHG